MTADNNLPGKAVLGYSCGALGLSFFYNLMVLYLLYYYTDIFGISAAAAGTMFLAARIWDAVNDPIMGTLVDRTRGKRGKFGPYIIFGTLPLALVVILIFNPVFRDMTMAAKLVYAYCTYILFGMLNTLVGIPYNSIQAVLTKDPSRRVGVVLGVRVFDMLGALIIAVLAMPLVKSVGGTSEAVGFGRVSIIFSVIAAAVIYLSYGLSRRRILARYEEDILTQKEKNTLKKSLAVVLDNRPLRIIVISLFLSLTATVIRQSAIIYYFKYNVGRESLMPLFNLLTLGVTALSMLLVPPLAKKMGKKRAALAGVSFYTAGNLLLFFVPPAFIPGVFITAVIGSLGTGVTFVAVMSMLPDTVEYGEWKTGVRSEGVIYSTYSFIQKLSMALAGALGGVLLTAGGYQANVAQGASSLLAIRSMLALFPAGAAVVGLICILKYDLTEEKHREIVAELEERKKARG